MVWTCCGVVPILFGWLLRIPSLNALVFIRKTFLWLVYAIVLHVERYRRTFDLLVPCITYYSAVKFCLPAGRLHCMVILPVGHIRAVLQSKTTASTATVCIASFDVIGELQSERLRHSRAAAFTQNGWTRGQLLQAKNWVPSSLPHHRLQRARSVADIFYTGEVNVPRGG